MKTVWACLCAGDILVKREGETLSLPVGTSSPVELKPWNRVTSIKASGTDNIIVGEAAMSLDVTPPSPEIVNVVRLDKPIVDVEGLEMMGLRRTFGRLSEREYSLAGKAAELVYWDSNSKFCGCCGAPMRWETEISKKCTNCGKELWPQLATAVIVRITMGERILLVRARNFRSNHFGLVAGFVETGETLEEAVQREVREETGLEIKNLHYFGSQPWPYPCGLMVGFTAEHAGGEVHLQTSELSQGGWFTRDNMPEIPDRASIARKLIDDWFFV